MKSRRNRALALLVVPIAMALPCVSQATPVATAGAAAGAAAAPFGDFNPIHWAAWLSGLVAARFQ